MPLITTQIEIAAPPAVVREKFLNFSQIPRYSPNGFIKALTSLSPTGTFNSGDRMQVVMAGASFKTTVLENIPAHFRWRGTFYWIFIGDHSFRFTESQASPGQTTFVHEENFSGLLGWIMGESFLARTIGIRESTRKNFAGFNKDLKAWLENE